MIYMNTSANYWVFWHPANGVWEAYTASAVEKGTCKRQSWRRVLTCFRPLPLVCFAKLALFFFLVIVGFRAFLGNFCVVLLIGSKEVSPSSMFYEHVACGRTVHKMRIIFIYAYSDFLTPGSGSALLTRETNKCIYSFWLVSDNVLENIFRFKK